MHRVRFPLFANVISLLATTALGAQAPTTDPVATVDHLVYATPDLERGISEIDRLLGVRATFGGQHPGRGTRNALVSLGPNVYLEIIAPDPTQPAPTAPRPFGLDDLKASRLAGWAAKSANLDSTRQLALRSNVPLGDIQAGSRKRPDGVLLAWRVTSNGNTIADGIVPFFIDWGTSPHPSATAPKGATLLALRAEHPDDRRVQRMLESLHLEVAVTHAAQPALVAVIDGRHGRVQLH